MSESNGQPGQHGWGWADPIPDELLERDQWVVTNEKHPVRPRDDWNNPEKQFDYRSAYHTAVGTRLEPAFVLHADDPFVIVDFDDVGPPDELAEPIKEFLASLGTYTEISRSGTGIHAVCRGVRLPDRLTKAELDGPGKVEVFDANQYVVLTGNRLGPVPAITPGGEDLIEFQREVLPKRRGDGHHGWDNTKQYHDFGLELLSTSTVSLTPTDIRRTIKEYAAGGSDGAKRALRLWGSSGESADRYTSASEADLAFCSDLAFWCQEDARLMVRCFRASSRHRDKWRQVSYKDGRTYGEGTLQVAIATNYATYSVDRYVVWK